MPRPAPESTVALEIVTRAHALARLAPEWASLWARCELATPFQSPAWLVPWWRHLGCGELITLALRRAGQLVGLAPLYIHTAAQSGARSVLLLGTGTTDYLDVLLAPGCEQDGMTAWFDYLHTQRHRWDICDFQQLRPGSALLSATAPGTWSSRTGPQDACPVLTASEAHERDLEQCVPASLRNKLRAYWRRLLREHTVCVEQAGADTAHEVLGALCRLHRARWAERGQPGVLDDVQVRRFHADAIPALLSCGVLRLYALRLDRHIVAVYYGLLYRRRAYYYLSGFAPTLQRLSLGNLVVHHALREAAREHAQAFDFLRGQEPYKYRWGATDCITYQRQLDHRSSAGPR